MKFFTFTAFCAVLLCTACQNKDAAKTTAAETKSVAQISNADSIGIADALHGFFTWYEANSERLSKIDFTNEKGKHVTLDEKKMQAYHDEVKKSGYVSDEFIADETQFYRACAKLWQNEHPDDIPSGMDADRYLCAQDFVAPYNTGAVASIINGDRAQATLTLTGGAGEKSDFKFEMKKENGKWLLAKLGCDMGVKY